MTPLPLPLPVVSRSQSSDIGPAVLHANPWLQAHFDSKKKLGQASATGGTSHSLPVKDMDSKPALGDEVAERAFTALEEKRQEGGTLLGCAYSDFATMEGGGLLCGP